MQILYQVYTKDPVKEVEGHKEDRRIVLLWDFDVDQILSANTSGVAVVIPDTDDICVTPLLAAQPPLTAIHRAWRKPRDGICRCQHIG